MLTVWPVEVGIMFAESTHYIVLVIAIDESNLMAALLDLLCFWGKSTINLKGKIHQLM